MTMNLTISFTRFDKYYISRNRSFSEYALDDWLSKFTYWDQLKEISIEKLHSIFSPSLHLVILMPTLYNYIQTWKFATFNSIFYPKFNSEKVKKHNVWDEQPNIYLAMKHVLYMYNLFFTICLSFSLYVLHCHSMLGCVGIVDMFWFCTSALHKNLVSICQP